MVRLKDIAARSGVSLMTVSKVLRDAPDVSAATKARIRRLAEEMGYVPDALARGLRTRKTGLLGLVVPSLADTDLGETTAAIQDRVHELGYDLLVAQTRATAQREEAVVRRLLSRRIDGLFIAPVYRLAPSAPIYDELKAAAVPTVLLGARAGFCASFPGIETDDLQASAQLTQHLLGLGHRQIAFFAGPPAAPWAIERLEGYRRALREAHIPYDDRLVFTAGATVEDGQRAANQLLSETTVCTAVQAAIDAVALGAAAAFLSRKLRIPEDISVAGFGNGDGSEHFRVPLTTVCLPKQAAGLEAIETMLRLFRGEAADPKRLSGQVMIRASTGAPRSVPEAIETPASSEPTALQGDDLE